MAAARGCLAPPANSQSRVAPRGASQLVNVTWESMVEHDGTAASSPVTSCRTSRPPDTPKAPIRLPMGMAAPGHHPGPLPAAVGHEVGGRRGSRGSAAQRACGRARSATQTGHTLHSRDAAPHTSMASRVDAWDAAYRACGGHGELAARTIDMPPLAGNMARS